ncbi:hypothetical protein FJR45_06695 [Sulfurimonas sediminis]|uniref:Uncharacterized protein n=1 Tax=Sulfurimonas sediminis TaxID=2590020 RepID=A0A7M1B1P2_9BACT|nr:hypothetical protein [Sulfurimonas sediminis]QOP43654.1 hypothetical protein FJR45_06695 [Sulfurimonas sediminis]
MNTLDAIELKYTKDEKEKEAVIEQNKKRTKSIDEKYKKGNYTGTQKADEFILKHVNKKTGNFGWKRF